jgi:hypothetical protein
LWGAKVIYLICHELNPSDIEALLVPLGAVDTGSLRYEKVHLGKSTRWANCSMFLSLKAFVLEGQF